tara:strand:- start:380 stop:505 length:126 start_codon:yes stop_codon:yes gene_type:complete
MHINKEQRLEEERAKRRHKKKNPKMAVHGRGMKRFAGRKKK